MLSRDFTPAVWRGTTNTDGKVIGVSFDTASGATIRLALDVGDARRLVTSMLGYLGADLQGTNCHSESSSGSPKPDGSPQEGQ